MGTLVTTPRRAWTTDFPGERPTLREARLRRPPPNGGFYEGNTLAITAPDNARQWTREIGVLDADVIFSDLVRQGF